MNAHHMRAMLGTRAVGGELNPREPKYKADQLIVHERTRQKAPIMYSSDQDVGGDDIRFAAWPDGALQGFYGRHIFRGFKDSYHRRMHGQRGIRNVFCIFSETSVYQGLRTR